MVTITFSIQPMLIIYFKNCDALFVTERRPPSQSNKARLRDTEGGREKAGTLRRQQTFKDKLDEKTSRRYVCRQ